MDENKNNEMSVDELLEKLKASLQTEEIDNKTSADKTEDEEIKNAVASAIGNIVNDSQEEELPAEPIDVEVDVEEQVTEQVTEEPASLINDEDLFAAWGIDRMEILQNEPVAVEDKAEILPETPAVQNYKIYQIAKIESKETFKARKQSEEQKTSVEYDSVDYSLIKQALGMEKAVNDENKGQTFEVDSSYEVKTIDIPHAEFTYQRQQDDFSSEYAKVSRTSCIKLVLTAVFTFFLFALECLPTLGVKLPAFLDSTFYPVVYSMANLQLVWLCAAVCYKEIANGFLGILKFRFTPGGLLGISVLFCTVCGAVCTALGSTVAVYHFSTAFLALIIRVFDFLDIRREMLAFDIVSSVQSQKYVALNSATDGVAQVEGLEDYTGEDSLILRAEKCTFVENYFTRTSKRSDRDIVGNKYIVPVLFAVAVISLIITLAGGEGAAMAFSAFNMTFAVGLPTLVLLSSAYPLYKAAKKLYRSESAIVGESAVDEYSGTTMICFDDADAFPSYGVGLESLRIYGNSDIETIIEQMGAVFSKLGGPLKHVFTLMTSDCPRPYKVKIEGVYENGIKAIVDGRVLFVGNADYMKYCGFTVLDTSAQIGGKQFSTMYLAEENGLRAKFFIRYTLDGGFESIVKKLARHGIASVILTGDSNINDALLAKSLDIAKLPVKVVRRSPLEGGVQKERADSGVVSRSGVGELVGAVTMCDRLARVIATMRAVRIATAVICTVLVGVLSALKMTDSIPSLYVLVYHLFWLIPSWLVTKFNL